jgi:hypothetical protein
MKNRLLLITASAVLATIGLNAQTQPAYYQTVACVKVTPGKFTEFRQFVNDTTKKMAESRTKTGEIVSWSLLRSVMPAGAEARCDFMVSTNYEGAPPKPPSAEDTAKSLENAGVKMTAAQYYAKRDMLSHLVAMEMWRPRVRVGHPEKGHYVLLNHMAVHNAADYFKFEMEIWHPLAEEYIKEGIQSGWQFSTLLFPGGTDVKYRAVSADIYPTWEAVFKTHDTQASFKKVHPDKDYEQTMGGMSKLRDLAQRDLLVIEERVAKQDSAMSTR